MKKALAILLILCMVFALAACGSGDKKPADGGSTTSGNSPSGGGDASTSPSGGGESSNSPSGGGSDNSNDSKTVTFGVSADSGTLDPIGVSGSGGFIGVTTCVNEPLWNYKDGLNMNFVLATSIDEISPTNWTIHLREGVTFSNGNPFTADDVLRSFVIWQRDQGPSSLYTRVIDFDNTKKIDDYTIDMHFLYYDITYAVSMSMLLMMDDESYEPESMALNPIGTGPYIVTEYVVNSHTYMIANENYWGTPPAIKNITFRVLNESAQMVNALETGLVDIVSIPTQDLDYVTNLPGIKIHNYASGFCPNIAFNVTENSIFNNVDARYAICYATDRDAIVNLAYNGQAKVTDNPLTQFALDYEPRFGNLHDTYSIGFNLELAKEYADKSGLTGQTIRVVSNGSEQYVTTAEILQATLKDIGVTVDILNYDQATLRTITSDPTAYDISLYATASPSILAADMIYNYVMFSVALSAGGWPGFDRFMEVGPTLVGIPSMEERSGALYEMFQIFTNACLWYGVCDTLAATAYRDTLTNYNVTLNGTLLYAELQWA